MSEREGARQRNGYRPALWVLAAFAWGILADHFWEPARGFWEWAAAGGLGLAGALTCWGFLVRSREAPAGSGGTGQGGGRARRAWWMAWGVLSGTAALGGLRHHVYWNVYPVDELGHSAPASSLPVCLECQAHSTLRRHPVPLSDPLCSFDRPPLSEFDAWCDRVRDGRRWQPASGRLRVTLEGDAAGLAVRPGQRYRVWGRLQGCRPGGNPGDDSWWYCRAARRLAVVRVESPAALKPLAPAAADSFCPTVWRLRWLVPRGLAALRERGEAALFRYVGPRQGPLAAAMLLGNRHLLSKSQLDQFVAAGLVHVLAISGMHVGILVLLIRWPARVGLAPRRVSAWLAILFSLGYAALTEAATPVVRAAVFVSLAAAAQLLGRRPLNLNTLAAAALLILWRNPTDLFRAGAQLSFLSVGALAQCVALWRPLTPADPLQRLILRSRSRTARGTWNAWQLAQQTWVTSAIVWLVTAPLVASRFHRLAPVGVAVNPLAWGPLVVALPSGLLTLMLGDLCPPASWCCGTLCAWGLAALEALTRLAGEVAGPGYWVGGWSNRSLVIWYFGLLVHAVWPPLAAAPGDAAAATAAATAARARRAGLDRGGRRRASGADAANSRGLGGAPHWRAVVALPGRWWRSPSVRKWLVAGWLALSGLSALNGFTHPLGPVAKPLAAFLPPPASASAFGGNGASAGAFAPASPKLLPGLRGTFLDMGHGTCLLVELPGGKRLLYDAGRLGPADRATRTVSAFLWARRITTLDAVVISHADVDHYNALPGILERFHVKCVYVPTAMLGRHRGRFAEPGEGRAVAILWEALDRHGVPLRTLAAGDQLALDVDVTIDVLHPPPSGISGSDNANSAVLLFTYQGRRILLPGDVEGQGIAALVSRPTLPVDLAMAPHHGSAFSEPLRFLNWCRPARVVISNSANSPAALNASLEPFLAFTPEVYHTARDGAVAFVITRGGSQTAVWRRRAPGTDHRSGEE